MTMRVPCIYDDNHSKKTNPRQRRRMSIVLTMVPYNIYDIKHPKKTNPRPRRRMSHCFHDGAIYDIRMMLEIM